MSLRAGPTSRRSSGGGLPFALFAVWTVAAVSAAPALGQEQPDDAAGPESIDAARQLLQSGAAIPPDAQKYLEQHPELKEQLVQGAKKKAEDENKDKIKGIGAKGSSPSAIAAQAPPPPRYEWQSSHYLKALFGSRLAPDEKATLSHYGHELFQPRSGGAAVLEDMPVNTSYVVGPGDQITVKTWGRLEGTTKMTVDRDGRVYYPKLGALDVAGKTFGEVKALLQERISKMAEVQSEVSLGELKASRVSVVGEVGAAGWYNVSSLHTALQALYLAGGVKDIGSMRHIELRRGGKIASRIDLYDLLRQGDSHADLRLLQGDTIFVPVLGRSVVVAGDVRRPAIYELAEESSLAAAIQLAGGFSASAYTRRVQVERLDAHQARIVLDLDKSHLDQTPKGFALADGDIIRVLPIIEADQNVVTLEGNVSRPGRYEVKPGLTVGKLLEERPFLPETWFDYALLTRVVAPDFHKELIPVNLREILLDKKAGSDIALKGRDVLKVYPRSAFKDPRSVIISGEVRGAAERVALPESAAAAPPAREAMKAERTKATARAVTALEDPDKAGKADEASRGTVRDRLLTFEIADGARITDLVTLAGGLTKDALLDRAELIRVDAARRQQTIYFDLGKALAGDPKENLVLEDEDRIRVHSVWETRQKHRSVSISGEVRAPGEFLLTEGMRLSDLLFKAGGLKESAFASEGELARYEVLPDGSLRKTETRKVALGKVVAGEAEADLGLQVHDQLVVHLIPDWNARLKVTLSGEVKFPGVYVAKKGERLSEVVARAGGFTADAYLHAAQFARESTRRSQQAAIDRLVEELELSIAEKAQELGPAADKDEVEYSRELMMARKSLLGQLRKAKATGRVIIRLPEGGGLAGTPSDLLIEDGDRLELPKKMNVVNVVGRVYNPTGVVFDPENRKASYYLEKVGGPTETADTDHIFVLRADGSVVVSGGMFGASVQSAKLEPGDAVVVPERLVQTRWVRDLKDITQILMQIAVTTAVVLRL